MLGMMQYNYLKIKFFILVYAFLLSNLLIAQKYIFEGDPQLIFEEGVLNRITILAYFFTTQTNGSWQLSY